MEGSGEARIGQTEKLIHNAVVSETSADPTGTSGAGKALQSGNK